MELSQVSGGGEVVLSQVLHLGAPDPLGDVEEREVALESDGLFLTLTTAPLALVHLVQFVVGVGELGDDYGVPLLGPQDGLDRSDSAPGVEDVQRALQVDEPLL